MTQSMIETVARAIDPEVWADALPIPTRVDTIAFHAGRARSIALARAAILAMREPSDAMAWAGSLDGNSPYARETWRTMIDTALGGQP